MQAQGFLDQKTRVPSAMVIAIVIHAAALSALWLAKNDFIPEIEGILIAEPIPLPQPEPEPTPLPAPKDAIPDAPRAPVDARVPIVPIPADADNARLPIEPFNPFGDGTGATIEIDPLPLPILTDASVDPRFANDFQPPYPAGKQRLGEEGLVVVRVLIGADGRVKRVESVDAADDAFFAATERQALRRWRFTPATRDGVAIESWRTMTVRFEITG